MQNNMKNLVGRKLIALQNSFLGLTKGKEYEIIKQENDKFWIVTDKGTKEFTFLINSDLLKLVDKPKFKQGDKVLVSNNCQEWHERIFVVEHNNLYQCEPLHENISNILTPWQHIKPYEEEIKIGDWVHNRNGCIMKCDDVDIFNINNWTKITDEVLINKLNEL